MLTAIISPTLHADLMNVGQQTVRTWHTGGTDHQYGWYSCYDAEVRNETMYVSLDIQFVGYNPGSVLNVWEDGIESVWSDQFVIAATSGDLLRVMVDVDFVDSDAHHIVESHAERGRGDMLNWYPVDWGGWPDSYQDQLAAHEVGHMFGNYDEYSSGAVNPTDPGTWSVPGSIMGGALSAQIYPRHYTPFVDWLESQYPGQDFVVAQKASLYAGIASAPYAPGAVTIGTGNPVPEPSTILLLMVCLGLSGRHMRSQHRHAPAHV